MGVGRGPACIKICPKRYGHGQHEVRRKVVKGLYRQHLEAVYAEAEEAGFCIEAGPMVAYAPVLTRLAPFRIVST